MDSKELNRIDTKQAGQRAEELVMQLSDSGKEAAVDTVLAHAGISLGTNAPLSPPMHMATTYCRPSSGPYGEDHSIYSRLDNPTRMQLEEEIAGLECHGRDIENAEVVCCAFASGMMAASSIVLAHQAPLLVLLPQDLYHGVKTVMVEVFNRFHVNTRHVDMMKSESLKRELDNSNTFEHVLVWIETPSNPLCHVVDIEATCKLVKETRPDATIVVDATMATPFLIRPLVIGADISMHSGTKGIAGHSDALIGLATASPWTKNGRKLGSRLKEVQVAVGGVASTMDSWLALRGLRTLAVRVRQQSQSALRLALFLQQQAVVQAVHYPGLESCANHSAAKRQMRNGFGSVFSVDVKDELTAFAVAGALRTAKRATSLGGTETLVEHRYSIEPPERRVSPPGLLRVSVGLEDVEDLIADFKTAIEVAQKVVSS